MAVQQHPQRDHDQTRGGPPWQHGLPVLTDSVVTLREVQLRDAGALLDHLSNPAVAEHGTPPPSSVQDFRRYIGWARRERRQSRHVSFAIVPPARAEPVGIIQAWPIDPAFQTMEWGFVIDPVYWGTELFARGARLLFAYAFDELGANRVEARVCADNERGQAALRKVGAVREGILRGCFKCRGAYTDYVMWAITAEDRGAVAARTRGVA